MSYVLIACILFPFLTPLIFLITANDDGIRKILNKKHGKDLELIKDINDTSFYKKNQIDMFTNGKIFFDDLFKEIENAKDFIHLNFFIFNTNNIGKKLIKLLETKLKQNVEVKVLYDRLGSLGLKKKDFNEYKKLGGELYQFTPLYYKPFFLNINYRNHRKIVIIDNKVSYIGGFNVSDEYLSRDEKMGLWVDCNLKIIGDATNEINKRFLCDFCYAAQRKIAVNKYLTKEAFSGNKKLNIISSGADINKINTIESQFIKLVYNAKDYIYFQTPYFVLSDAFMHALKDASQRNVKIKIMIPSRKDHIFVKSANKAYTGSLIDQNTEVYFFPKDGFLHSKVFICDDFVASIGTCNFDIRSFKYSLEINPFVYDQEITLKAKDMFLRHLEYCSQYTLEMYQNRSIFTRIKEDMSKLFSTLL
jgi:cardiolipin synthase